MINDRIKKWFWIPSKEFCPLKFRLDVFKTFKVPLLINNK